MEDPRITIDGDTVTIIAKLDPKGRPSSTKNSIILATTGGNKKFTTEDGTQISVGLTIFKKPE